MRERADEVNRLQKTLEGANINLASVATDIMGKSGRAMLAGLVDGTTDLATLATLAKGRLREKRAELARALQGRIAPHQRFLLVEQLSHIDTLEEAIDRVSAEIATRMDPVADQLAALDTIPGVSQRVAEILIAEIGTEMAQFPSAHHLASWAGMCPGNNESAGKRKSGKTRKGAIRGCGPSSSRRGALRRISKGPICPPTITDWRSGAGAKGQRWRSATPSS